MITTPGKPKAGHNVMKTTIINSEKWAAVLLRFGGVRSAQKCQSGKMRSYPSETPSMVGQAFEAPRLDSR